MRPVIAMGGCLVTVLGVVVVLSALTVSCVSAGGGLPLPSAWYSPASCNFGWVVAGGVLVVGGLVALVYGLVAARRSHPAVPQR